MLHVPCAVQNQQVPSTGDIFDDSIPSCEWGRMVCTDRGCLPTYLRLLEPGACKVYQLPSVRRLDQPAKRCQRSWNPGHAITGPVGNANQPHEENGLDSHLPSRVYVSTRTLTPGTKDSSSHTAALSAHVYVSHCISIGCTFRNPDQANRPVSSPQL